MKQTREHTDQQTDDERDPSAAEVEAWRWENTFLSAAQATPDAHPALYNISAGMMFDGIVRPVEPSLPDFVAIEARGSGLELVGQIGMWNLLWEAGQFRRRFFDEDEMPGPIAKLADLGDINTVLVPRTTSRYFEYAPIYHLIPKATLDRFGLPILRRGLWPFLADHGDVGGFLDRGFGQRLAKAWAWTVWPHLNSGSRLSAFSKDDPIRLLAHNLDFWIPPVTNVIQKTLHTFPMADKGRPVGPVTLVDGSILANAVTGNPRTGGSIWTGEAEASEVVAKTIHAADATGRLRSIFDAVRSHRVADDFSSQWSYAREDFERKLFRKRDKIQVRFIELTNTIPVQSVECEVIGKLVTSDFLALLDRRQREIVVLLSSGYRQGKSPNISAMPTTVRSPRSSTRSGSRRRDISVWTGRSWRTVTVLPHPPASLVTML